jgi:eukaryotic-like serine/threonine-protein kinase
MAHFSGAHRRARQSRGIPSARCSRAYTHGNVALTPGTRLGVYDITALIGEGGMGQVYRATDTNLKRQVAIKVLPESLAADPDRLARFQREAEVLAALNHPNIAHIHGLERCAGTVALVMELVEGEDLSQRIARGAIPLDEALPIAKQIAEALEAAHEQGIIHRDLKPANITVRSDGTVKVLDFGLAKAMEPTAGSSPSLSMSPTLTTPAMMTGAGMILGTAAYMSPEQAKGRTVDRRADVWAFGCVLYEMLTGGRAFGGDDVQDTFVAIMRDEPDWARLPASLPPVLGTYIKRCLQKDAKQRVQAMGDVRLALEGAFEGPAQPAPAATPSAAVPRPFWKRALPVAVTAVVVTAMAIAATWTLKPTPPVPSPPVTRFTLPLGEGQQFTAVGAQSLAVSPDGTRLVYVANNQLYLRSLADVEARPIPGGSQLAGGTPLTPVFSPDGQSIAFFSTVDRTIKKIAVSGGAAVTICPANAPMGMTWDPGGLVFGQGSKGILRVSANSGQPAVLATVKNGEVAASPQVLPGSDWVLFTVATAATAEGWDKAQIVVQSMKTAERKTLVSGGSDARYVPTGHLVYALGGVMFAVPFDLRKVAVTGGPVPVIEGVKRAATGSAFSTAHLSISSTGSLVFVPGPVSPSAGQFDLALFDRTGTAQPLKLTPGPYEYPRLSPDGKRIAFGSDDGKDAIVWIYDVSGATSIRRLTLGGRNRVPVWAADGEHVAFQSDREGDLGIFWQRADGTTAAERLTKPDKDTAHVPESWSPDGKTLLFSVAKGSSYALAALSFPDKTVTLVGSIQSAFPPAAVFSPDGKWIAYSAGGVGAAAGSLFVQPFPPTGATYPISKTTGIHALWSPDGKELFYGAAAGPNIVAVSVTTRPTFTFGNPVPVPRMFVNRGPVFERPIDITLDGKRFLGVVVAGSTAASGASAAPQIQVVLNWFEELKARVPTK